MIELLARQMDDAWRGFGDALEGLTEEEYHWRPSSDTLTLAHLLPPDSEDWRTYYAKMPSPPPLSTVEYKVAHVATCEIMYSEYAFRGGMLRWRWADLNVPTTLSTMRPYLEDAHTTLRSYLDELTDSDLPLSRKTNWGEFWPTERILWEMIVHDVYHGAQIRTMRTLYRVAGGTDKRWPGVGRT